ncbi:MAG: hypothetical protein P8P30_10340 [Rickettsiales bacterium]|nr:hypothetical protein [Rickettsiales bacterium]
MNFTAKLLINRGHSAHRFYYLNFSIDGRVAYYFVLIDPPKEPAFLVEMQKNEGMIDLEEFALEIVARGYGIPSQNLKEEMQQKYGIKFEGE